MRRSVLLLGAALLAAAIPGAAQAQTIVSMGKGLTRIAARRKINLNDVQFWPRHVFRKAPNAASVAAWLARS